MRAPTRDHLLQLAVTAVALGGPTSACTPLARPADFPGARQQVTTASVRGPFDGVVLDATTDEPVADALVVGVYTYEHGVGLTGPRGSEVVTVETDAAGRYRLPRAPGKIRGRYTRLTEFTAFVYKAGFAPWRSDVTPDGRRRVDFAARRNQVTLEKTQERDDLAARLVYLAPPGLVEQRMAAVRPQANEILYAQKTGRELAPPAETEEEAGAPRRLVLDASALLTDEEIRIRTGYTDDFEQKELGDFPREAFYHGVHWQAVDRDETHDVAYRVWHHPPGGLDPVRETFQATLPGVAPSGEVTEETYVYDADDVRAVAFIDAENETGVLLTCGANQCADLETAIILAKLIARQLERLDTVPLEVETPDPAATEKTTPAAPGARPPETAPETDADAPPQDPARPQQPQEVP